MTTLEIQLTIVCGVLLIIGALLCKLVFKLLDDKKEALQMAKESEEKRKEVLIAASEAYDELFKIKRQL